MRPTNLGSPDVQLKHAVTCEVLTLNAIVV